MRRRAVWNPLDHHRGPFRLSVIRETPARKIKWHAEALKGTFKRADIPEEAQMLLTDPRDTITSVLVWSVSEQRHVTTYKRPVRRRS